METFHRTVAARERASELIVRSEQLVGQSKALRRQAAEAQAVAGETRWPRTIRPITMALLEEFGDRMVIVDVTDGHLEAFVRRD